MKKLLFIFLMIAGTIQAQVGIGTVTPEAILDIRSSSQTAPANNDGILIPKIDEFPATIPTAAQDGMLVFATGDGGVSKGFYYWDTLLNIWVAIGSGNGGGDAWYEEGTTTVPNNINDDIYTFGNVAIGKNTANYKLDIFESTADNLAYLNLAGSSNNPVSGLTTEITNTGDGDQRGMYTILNSSGTGNHYGVLNTLSGGGIGFKQGIRNELAGTSNGSQTGSRNVMTNTGNGTHLGVNNTLSGIGTGNHIGVQNSFSGTGSGFHTGFYSTFSEGTGILTGNWTEFGGNLGSSTSNQIAAYNSYIAGGDGILAGSYTEIRSSVTGNGTQYGSFLNNSSSGSGIHYGIRNQLTGIGTGDQEGVSTLISNTNDANHFGLNTRLDGTGTGSHIGAQFSMSGTGSGFHTGTRSSFTEGTGILTGNWTEFGGNIGSSTSNQIATYNSYFAGGSGILAGTYTDIRNTVAGNGSQYGTFLTNSSSGSGTHYGVRSELSGAGTGAQEGISTLISNSSNSNHFGMNTRLSGTGSGNHIGAQFSMSGTGNGFHTGTFTSFTEGTGILTGNWIEFGGNVGSSSLNQIANYNSYFAGGNGILAGAYTDIRNSVTGTGSHYGTFTSNDSPGGGIHYGNYNSLSGTGTGAKYGTYNAIPAATGGTHYGVYSDVQKTGSYSGYFIGRMAVMSGDVGIRTANPGYDIHLKQTAISAAGRGGLAFENAGSTDIWKVYHSGTFLSFAENGVRRAYITNGTGNYVATSDRRLKKQIVPTTDVLSKVINLNVYNYLYRDQDDSSKKTIGFMAQDVQPIFPELVETDEDGYMGLNYAGFGVIAIKAIQEQQLEVESLKKQLEEQQKEIANIKKLLELRN